MHEPALINLKIKIKNVISQTMQKKLSAWLKKIFGVDDYVFRSKLDN